MAEEFWGVVELMGHVRLAGKVSEEERFGCKLGRIDVPTDGEKFVTIYFGGSSIYRVTPCDEESARAVAVRCAPAPVHRYEMPQIANAAESQKLAPVGRHADNRHCPDCGRVVEECECEDDDRDF